MFVSILMVRALLDECGSRGVTADALLAGSALTSERLADGLGRLPAEAFAALAHRAMQLTGDEGLGLSLGARLPPQALQVIGYLLWSAPTLRGAYLDFQRYGVMLAENPRWALREEGERARFEFSCWLDDPRGMRMASDWSLSLAYRIIQSCAPAAIHNDIAIEFMHPRPRHVAAYAAAFFGAQVGFGRARNAVSLPRAWLDQRRLHGDATTCAGLRELAEPVLATIGSRARVSDRLRVMLRQERKLADMDAAELARSIGLSQAALRRKLAGEGVTPLKLIDEARCRLACSELGRLDVSVKQLASELGYAELRSFHRAFKRWTGKTPGDYRAQVLRHSGVRQT